MRGRGARGPSLSRLPEGGNRGGEIVAQGTPEEVAAVEGSYTGQYLKPLLGK